MNSYILITGINGQLGQYLAKYILEKQPHLTVIGTVRHKSYDNQQYIFDKSKVIFELMDLSDSHSIENLIVKYKPDYFINTAANAFVAESWMVPVQHFEINCIAVLHQLESIRKYSPHTKYFNMGTSEEFGDVKYSPQDEKHILSPRSPYGCSKAAARFVVKVYRESYNLYALQGWTFNFESKIRGEKYVTRKITKGVARIYHALKNGESFEPIELGNLDAKRSWQHAEDVCSGIWLMLNQPILIKTDGVEHLRGTSCGYIGHSLPNWKPKEYILSSIETHSVRQFVEKAFLAANIKGTWINGQGLEPGSPKVTDVFAIKQDNGAYPILVQVNPKFLRPADVEILHGDSSLIKKELGWEPKITFDELITEMVQNDIQLLTNK